MPSITVAVCLLAAPLAAETPPDINELREAVTWATVELGAGSGFLVEDDPALVVTAAHVAEELPETFLVRFKNGAVIEGRVVWRHPPWDMALIQLERVPKKVGGASSCRGRA